jgi:hypothetical protein
MLETADPAIQTEASPVLADSEAAEPALAPTLADSTAEVAQPPAKGPVSASRASAPAADYFRLFESVIEAPAPSDAVATADEDRAEKPVG